MARPSIKTNGFNSMAVQLQAPISMAIGYNILAPVGLPEFKTEDLADWVPVLSEGCGKRGHSCTMFTVEDIPVHKSARLAKRTILKAMRSSVRGPV